MRKWKFEVARSDTGEWIDFTLELPSEVEAVLLSRPDRMAYLQKALSDERFDGRAMMAAPVLTPL